MNKKPLFTCDAFRCVLVCPCLVSGFLALLHNHCYSLQKTKSRLVISIWLQGPGPVATKMPFSRRNSNSLEMFSAPAQEGNLFFSLWEITRHFSQSARRGEEKIQLPTLLGQQCWELSFAPVLVALLAVCSRAGKRPATRETNPVKTVLLYN